MITKRTPGFLGTCLLLACLLSVVAGCGTGGGVAHTVLFRSGSGLDRGDEVRMSGFVIGKVERVELEPDGRVAVGIRLFPKYGHHLTEGARFRVRREGIASIGRYIEVEPGNGSPVAAGTRFEGEPLWEDRLRALGEDLLGAITSGDVEAQFDKLAEAAEEAARAGAAEWEARRPELEAEGRELLRKLGEESGRATELLEQKLDAYLDEIEASQTPPIPAGPTS